jgi:hypothetical protein
VVAVVEWQMAMVYSQIRGHKSWKWAEIELAWQHRQGPFELLA